MIQPSTNTIQHKAPSLQAGIVGELDVKTSLALFRGIPYATVSERWTHSKTKNDLNNPFDATSFGPRCVQGQGKLLVSGGVNDPVPGDHEFDCLNLNITVPEETLRSPERQPLPVMVWIHGGSFNYGANSVARYRPSKLCAIAAAAGNPVVLVQIGYRLGPLGFAASADLAAEAEKTKEPFDGLPKMGSYGLVDQRNAFEWVQNHIRDFGGDPNNVTAFGVSAGSACIHFHILSGKPLFDRAIMMSGSAPTIGPLPLHFYDKAWIEMCQKLEVTEKTAEARVEHLRSLKPEDIVANHSKAAMGPWGDGNYLPSMWDFKDAARSRCKAIILGDTRVEAIILDGIFNSVSQKSFQKLVRSFFSAEDAAGFAQTFKFSLDDEKSKNDYIDAMRHLFSVALFQYPNIIIAEGSNSLYETYLYHFEEPSPYPGPTYGLPYHGQCALYMHSNEVDEYPASGKQIAQEMATSWTAFACGKRPWEPYIDRHRFMRLGPGSSSMMQSFECDNTRDYSYMPWLRDHWDQTKTLVQWILQGGGR